MVMTGKIKFFTVGKRIKIPYMNLVKFIEEQTVKHNHCDTNFISIEEISQKIDELIAGYSKTNLN